MTWSLPEGSDAGGGNDLVVLGSGTNSNNPQAWSRYQDWQGIRSTTAYGDYFEHGLGAWIDLGAGNDSATGTDANDFIIGGSGSDRLDGQAGADTYLIGYEAGSVDHVSDLARTMGGGWDYYDSWGDPAAVSPPNEDTVEFDDSVSLDDLSYDWATTPLNDPNAPISSASTLQLYKDGQLFLKIDYFNPFQNDWYSKAGVEQFRFTDGHTLSLSELLSQSHVRIDNQAQNLVQAMASFSPPAAGQTTLASSYQSSLTTGIAADWR